MNQKIIVLSLFAILGANAKYSEVKKEIENQALEALLLNIKDVKISNLADLRKMKDQGVFTEYDKKDFSYILASEMTQKELPCKAGTPATTMCAERITFSTNCYPQNEEAVLVAEQKAQEQNAVDVTLSLQCSLVKLTTTLQTDVRGKVSVEEDSEGSRYGEFSVKARIKTENGVAKDPAKTRSAEVSRDAVKEVILDGNSIRIGFAG